MKSILFDFFGTLVHYSTSRVEQGYEVTHALVREHGIEIEYNDFLSQWGRAHDECDRESNVLGREYRGVDVGAAFLRNLGAEGCSASAASRLWRSYIAEWSKGIRYIPGVPEMVRRLSEQYKIGVLSNTHDAQLVREQIQKSGVEPYLDVVVTSVEHGVPKPDASIFELALDLLGSKASDTLFVGDSYVHDYVGATNVGMKALLIATRSESRAPLADTIPSVLEVSDRLSRIRAAEPILS